MTTFRPHLVAQVHDNAWPAAGRVIEARKRQLAKAARPMEVRPSGRVIKARERQSLKAQAPMEVRLADRVIEARESQPSKA